MPSDYTSMGTTGNSDKFKRTAAVSSLPSKKYAVGISDVQSDIIVQVGDVGFALHKFPLSSRSGRIRKLVADLRELHPSQIELHNLPGGTDAFELAAKFCYGINFEITASNVALLYCAADYLEMTEAFGEKNLIARTEEYFKEVVLQSLEKSVEVLHACESILPLAEEKRIVNKCIDSIASAVCKEQASSNLYRLNYNHSNKLDSIGPQYKAVVEWWADDLSVLRIDLFQRVVVAMRSRGLRNESIGGALIHFAQRSLKAFSKRPSMVDSNEQCKTNLPEGSSTLEHEQRIVMETIVSLLPAERNIVPTSFLFGLLRAAMILDTTVACKLDLERRIGSQLDHATLDDLLIPSLSTVGNELFDVDVVHRVLASFLQQEDNQNSLDTHAVHEPHNLGITQQTSILRIGKLIEMYLAEIAPDANLKVPKFVALAELLPDHARVVDDGLYRATDIYLKAHPTLSEVERKKICKTVDCQKLSAEACAHAAQNERLPVQFAVQVLYFEQLRLRSALSGPCSDVERESQSYTPLRLGNGTGSATTSPSSNNAALYRENRELKLEIAGMKMRLMELGKQQPTLKQEREQPSVKQDAEMLSSEKSSSSGVKFFSLMSKKFGKINLFGRKSVDSKQQEAIEEPRASSRRTRRHSIS